MRDIFLGCSTYVEKMSTPPPPPLLGLYRGFRDTGYLSFYFKVDIGYYPFYFQGYRILCLMFSLLPRILNIQEKYGDIWQFIRDTCLFTTRDMGYLVPPIQAPIQASLLAVGVIFLGNKIYPLHSHGSIHKYLSPHD